jgi:uncharacterized protein DUF6463
MTAIGAVGAATMPVSGFWLLIVEGIAATALRRRHSKYKAKQVAPDRSNR